MYKANQKRCIRVQPNGKVFGKTKDKVATPVKKAPIKKDA